MICSKTLSLRVLINNGGRTFGIRYLGLTCTYRERREKHLNRSSHWYLASCLKNHTRKMSFMSTQTTVAQKCETKFTALTDEKTGKICQFPRSEQVNFTELQLHSMRNGQEHASQLTLHLGRAGRSTLDQVARAGENLQRWP